MKTTIVNSSFAYKTMRIDGKFHLSDGLQVRKLIKNAPYKVKSIFDVTSNIYCPGIFQRHYTSSGTPFLGGADIQKQSYDSGKYLKESTTPNHEILAIKKGWTLVTCGGTVGETAFANRELAKCWVSQHVMRLIPDGIKPGMLYSYLATNEGKMLLTTNTYGSVIPTLNSNSIGELPIPEFPESFQQEVDDLIQKSARLREEATDALDKAISVIEDMIPYPSVKKNGTMSIEQIRESHNKRFEANYHISVGSEIEDYIDRHYVWKPLGEVCQDISRPDLFKRVYVQNGITFLGGADIFFAKPNSNKQLSKSKTANISSLAIQENTILIPRSGTIGNVAWAHAGHAQKLASEDVIRLKPNDILKGGYIYAFLSSSIGKALIQKHIFGSVIQHIEPPHLRLIPIPIIDDSTINETNERVLEYSQKVGIAIEKEHKAISMVEQEIESWTK
ncbi:MAG: restriction endonuclease subunit S [Prevotella salivae]|nr:restriction endonuclease subunit S [Segatella salivae]